MNKVITFGCRLNTYESEVIKKIISETGQQDTVVVNSCAVTNEVERQVKQQIRKINKESPEKDIVVVGCAAQLNPNEYANLPGVVKVLGNQDKLKKQSYLSNQNISVSNISNVKYSDANNLITQISGRSRALVQIQNGCNHSCTFCCTTNARGVNRSIPVNEISNQVKLFLDNGYNEIVFTGVDISDYGKDLPEQPSLAVLIRRVLSANPTLARIRLSSIDVAEIDEDLKSLVSNEKRVMPHLHLSVQSGNNIILKRMRRRHSREQVIDFCNEMRKLRPEIVFGADIIAGFPTETDKMFQDSQNLISAAGLTYLHIFPYSPKSGTVAAKMPQLPIGVRKMRAQSLRTISNEAMFNFHTKQIGKVHNVVVENENIGRSENFAQVKFFNSAKIANKEIAKLQIYDMKDNYLIGKIL